MTKKLTVQRLNFPFETDQTGNDGNLYRMNDAISRLFGDGALIDWRDEQEVEITSYVEIDDITGIRNTGLHYGKDSMDPPNITLEYTLDDMANQLTQSIMDNPNIQRYCDAIARERSGTQFWDSSQFEANEDTADYNLYWAEYALAQSRIVAQVLKATQGKA